jgi:RNA methyltransferase, TrmH family
MKKENEIITSIKDPRVVFARSLTSVANRQKGNACLLSGEKPLQWAIENGWIIESIFCTKLSTSEIEYFCPENKCYVVSESILKKISGTSYLIPILAVANIPHKNLQPDKNADILLLLDGIQDHGNLGTIIRSASAFGIHDVILSEMQSDLFHRKTIEASRGSVFAVHAAQANSSTDIINHLQNAGYQIIATTPYGSQLQSELQINDRPVVLVIGNESNGVSEEVLKAADACIQIPMQPEVESLNVGVAAGISMYEIKVKAVLGMLKKKIQTTLGREINVAGKLMQRQLNKELMETTRFTAVEAIFLMQLSCDQQMTLQQISYDTGLIGGELKSFIHSLENNLFIQAITNQEDTWQITQAGETWLAQIWPLVERVEKKALKGFSDNEVQLLYELIKRIQEKANTNI